MKWSSKQLPKSYSNKSGNQQNQQNQQVIMGSSSFKATRTQVCLVVGVTLLLTIGLILLASRNFHSCQRFSNEPNSNSTSLVSSDGKTLVNFLGHIAYTVYDNLKQIVFQPINIRTVVTKTSGINEITLDLIGECVNFIINLVKPIQENKYTSQSAHLNFELDGERVSCKLEDFKLEFDSDKHYSCKKKKNYLCIPDGAGRKTTDGWNVTLKDLEFEINAKNQSGFSTPPSLCS